jgi:two-component system chemotaxis response regulator CheB
MVVDDSAFIRGASSRQRGRSLFAHYDSVSNGEQAIRALIREPVDVIVLDIEMPIMDGLTALPKLKEIDGAVQVIMASTLTQKNAEISLKAMSLGATDYIPKPSSSHEVMGAEDFRRELVEKVKALGSLARRSGVREPTERQLAVPSPAKPASGGVVSSPTQAERSPLRAPKPEETPAAPRPRRAEVARPVVSFGPGADRTVVLRKEPINRPEVIAIGSSTGGPQALFNVIKDIGKGLPQPIVITQHMPASFTAILAEHISRQCGVDCTEAKDGDILVPGHFYVETGDNHMLIEGKGNGPTVRLTKDPPENFCRPAVDPMLRSLAAVYGRNMLVVILTGMGQDGMKGSDVVVKAGGSVMHRTKRQASCGLWPARWLWQAFAQLFFLEGNSGFVRQTGYNWGAMNRRILIFSRFS